MATVVSSSRQQTHHIDSLDGIRGVAILLVLSMHGGWFDNGWIGVDLFFVLSGFLITGILRRTRTEPFYWRRFYIKRATRILPPLLLGIAVTVLLWPHLSPVAIAGYVFSLGDVLAVTRFSIWPLIHLWSLSVEEHYYLLWPFAVLWLPKRKLQWVLIAIIILVPIGRMGFTHLLPRHDPPAIYYLTPFRIDGIALGSLLALLLEREFWREKLTKCSGMGAAAACAVYLGLRVILGHGHFSPFVYSRIFNLVGYSLVALIAFFVIAYAYLLPDAIPTRILRNKLLTTLGAISYGLYVYSWIVLVLIRRSFPSLSDSQAGLIHIVVAVPLSAVLFKYCERPITDWGRHVAAHLAAKGSVATKDTNPGPEGHMVEVEGRQPVGIVVT
jgi:peptidoglycan/LPS O-acetylase OafA/YrhL